MAFLPRMRPWSSLTLVCLGTAFFCLPLRAHAQAAEKIEDLCSQARQLERQGEWGRACTYYAYILSQHRHHPGVRERFHVCLRHFHRVRRHHDATYRQQVLNLDPVVALKVYAEALGRLRIEYVDEDKVDLTFLFRQGVQELRLALNDDAFRQDYLPEAKPEDIHAFLKQLDETWGKKEIQSSLEAQNEALKAALAAKKSLGLKPTVAILEFSCGACNALDEHTYYLTPHQLLEEYVCLRGESVGVGVEIAATDKKFIVSHVTTNGPAFRAGLVAGDQLVRIDDAPLEDLALDAVVEKLRGKTGSTVKIEAASANGRTKTYTLVRQPVNRSVVSYRMLDAEAGVAYLQLAAFHANASREMDEALKQLEAQGMKALVLDLRGNAGGLVPAALQVSERFLGEGAPIVSTHGRSREWQRRSHNPNPVTVPMVVLIDGGTASASEIVAGALKENLNATGEPRAILVGQTSFGKGTIQHLTELKSAQAGGVRLSWAKFHSPLNHSYDGIGVEPHFFVERTSRAFDEPLQTASQKAQLLAEPR